MSAELAIDMNFTLSDATYGEHHQQDKKVGALSDVPLQDYDWEKIVQETLVTWCNALSQFEDKDFEPPTRKTLCDAISLAKTLKERGWPPPTRIVPSVEGGVILERYAAPYLVTMELLNDGEIEYISFKDCKIMHRQSYAASSLV